MVFSSLTFIYLFLPASLVLYYTVQNRSWRNGVLIACSLFFYAWGEPYCVLLLMFSAMVDYIDSLIIDRYRGHRWIPRAMVAVSLCVNLGILVLFKYSAFIVTSINAATGLAFPVPQLMLPIGISFYTFQTLSYTIDVYRGEVPAQRSYFKLLMYVSMFHQLVAGPIVRYSQIASEIDNRPASVSGMSLGVNRFIIGLAKKVLFANACGQIATAYMAASPQNLTTASAWFGLIVYSMQYYFDFSGYSDMAIGLGLMFGFHYSENFNYPFISQSVSEYWRRWHISLGSWFRDYLFYPLMMSGLFRRIGGWARKHFGKKAASNLPTALALSVVWLATGLWHGANWNYVLWGCYFGSFLIIEMLFLGKLLQRLPRVLRHIYLLLVVVLGFSIFYFEDLNGWRSFAAVLFGFSGGNDPTLMLTVGSNIFFLIGAAMLCTPVLPTLRRLITQSRPPAYDLVFDALRIPVNVGLLLLCTACLVGQTYNPFMYFRF